MPELPPLRLGELRRVLGRIESLVRQRNVVLVGGQAVAFWADYLSRPGLKLPVIASKDIDFEGARTAAHRASALLDAGLKLPRAGDRTAITGVVTFVDSGGHDRVIDFLRAPYGLTAQDVRDTAVQVAVADPVDGREIQFWAMHPERSMESRIHNVVGLRRSGEQSIMQLNASIRTARAWSIDTLGDDSMGVRARQRTVLDLNERIFRKCRSDSSFRMLGKRHGIDPFDAVLLDERLPKQFAEKRYPQMVAALEAVRS